MRAALQGTGFAILRVPAVDARAPDQAKGLMQLRATGPTGAMGLGTLACSASHALAWAMFLADPRQPARGLFFEDDVEFAPDAARHLHDLMAHDYGHDLIKFEAGGNIVKGAVLGPAQPAALGLGLRRCYSLAHCAAGYVMTRAAARRALARFAALDVPVDHFLFHPGRRAGALGLPFVVTDPPLVRQIRALGSEIGTLRNRGARWRRDLIRAPYEAATLLPMWQGWLFGRARLMRMDLAPPFAMGAPPAPANGVETAPDMP